MLQFISGRLISFWNLFIRVNNSQYYFFYHIGSLAAVIYLVRNLNMFLKLMINFMYVKNIVYEYIN